MFCFQFHIPQSKKYPKTPGTTNLFLVWRGLYSIYSFIHNRMQIHGHILLLPYNRSVPCLFDWKKTKLGRRKKYLRFYWAEQVAWNKKILFSQASVSWKFVTVALGILWLFLSQSSFCLHTWAIKTCLLQTQVRLCLCAALMQFHTTHFI